jgi:type IV secretion system pilin
MFDKLHAFSSHFLAVSNPNLGPLPHVAANKGEINNALEIVFSITGAISLLVVVIAGLTFITSQGDPQKVSQAKNAIVYASAGLIISILAVSIVGFVIGNLG